jgi:hypothetical protein
VREPELALELQIENGGHRMRISGSAGQYVAEFPSLRSLVHFLAIGWRWRGQVPRGWRVQMAWRGLRWG